MTLRSPFVDAVAVEEVVAEVVAIEAVEAVEGEPRTEAAALATASDVFFCDARGVFLVTFVLTLWAEPSLAVASLDGLLAGEFGSRERENTRSRK